MSLEFSFLYYFSNAAPAADGSEQHDENDSSVGDLMEVKVHGLEEGSPPGKVYYWLHEDRQAGRFEKLQFQSMATMDGRHQRCFEQGELWFDDTTATLSTSDPMREVTLNVCSIDRVPEKLIQQVESFLSTELSQPVRASARSDSPGSPSSLSV